MHNLKLNLKHLRYFWAVASHGSIVAAAQVLCVTPQTISGQLRELEHQVGARLFRRSGRNLVLTDTGQLVFSYTDEMFELGGQLQEALDGARPGSSLTLKVGVAMVVPKLLAYRVLEPVLSLENPVRLVCHEAPLVDLLADLSVHKIDAVLADSAVTPTLNIRAYNHRLGESGISFFAPQCCSSTPDNGVDDWTNQAFPAVLQGQNMLMPTAGSSLRRNLQVWFERNGIRPKVVAEFEDRALMKAFGERGAGIFTSPTAVEQDVLDKYRVQVIGRTAEITEQFYLISAERRIRHPALSVITEHARDLLVR